MRVTKLSRAKKTDEPQKIKGQYVVASEAGKPLILL